MNKRELAGLRRRLDRLADPRAAASARAVHRCRCRFHGVSAERVRFLARHVARRHHGDRRPETALDLARALWKSPWHEEKVAAVHIAAAFAPRLGDEHWREFRRWIEEAPSAGHADAVAVQVLGRMVERDRAWCRVLCHWARLPQPRMRRAALGAVLLRTRHMGDVEAAFSVCERLVGDRARTVREAAAALLQEAYEVDPRSTREFLEPRRARLPRSLLRSILS